MRQSSKKGMVTVKFFAGFREKTGRREALLGIGKRTRLGEILETLYLEIPGLKEILKESNAVISVNKEIADDKTIVNAGDEVAIFPPVSGG